MTSHLLAISVGPVQEFIAAARRTRDLWFGSYLLSEISKAAAKAVHDGGGCLIFPAPNDAADLDADSVLNVSNVILAEFRGDNPTALAHSAREAAKGQWRKYADPVFDDYREIIREEIWREQVDDVVEFYAAWASCGPDTYREDRARVMRLLAGRKNCRDFLPAAGRAGVPKSSLDGLRESVIGESRPKRSGRRLRLRDGEQLDVIGVVKRAALGNRPYPSVSRVAADPWIRGMGNEDLADLIAACQELGEDVIHRLNTSTQSGHPHYAPFPFEGTAVFRSRHQELRQETELFDDELRPLRDALGGLVRHYNEPNPYLAVLVADGDGMGQKLAQLSGAEQHRQFSKQLSHFGEQARQIIDKHQGVLVYAGGDDVLAFVPVDRCLACARALYEVFGQLLRDWSFNSVAPTLSVGIAIAHFMENLEDLLGYGRAAENHAKAPTEVDGAQEERNALAVHLLKRGGGPVAVRANWEDRLDHRLAELAEHLNDMAIPGRVAADLRAIAGVYENWKLPAASLADAIQRDTLSVMKGKQPHAENQTGMNRVRHLVRTQVCDATSLRRLGDELLVARQIAVAGRQATGQSAIEEVRAS